ncbi:MAG: hypothetical protein ACR2IE_20730 [Candidatus Sumerlaeaceae bacterium]
MEGSLWVELVGNIIMARIRGVPTEVLLRGCQDRVLALLKDTSVRNVLYDGLELESPTVEITLMQQHLSEQMHELGVRVACVVANTRIAYLSRLAFGSGEHRIFYNDMGAAIRWLESGQPS